MANRWRSAPSPARRRTRDWCAYWNIARPDRADEYYRFTKPSDRRKPNGEGNNVQRSVIIPDVEQESQLNRRAFSIQPYRSRKVVLSLIRGQAGAAGVAPPETPPIVSFGTDRRTTKSSIPGSTFFPKYLDAYEGYDPDGGGAFFKTVHRNPFTKTRPNGANILTRPFPEPQDIDEVETLRHFTNLTHRFPPATRPLASFAQNIGPLRADANEVSIEARRFTATPVRRVAFSRPFPDVSRFGLRQITDTPTGGGYDIYHYYV